jgi:hypothetical protein
VASSGVLRRVALVRTDVSSCQPDDGGVKFLLNAGS